MSFSFVCVADKTKLIVCWALLNTNKTKSVAMLNILLEKPSVDLHWRPGFKIVSTNYHVTPETEAIQKKTSVLGLTQPDPKKQNEVLSDPSGCSWWNRQWLDLFPRRLCFTCTGKQSTRTVVPTVRTATRSSTTRCKHLADKRTGTLASRRSSYSTRGAGTSNSRRTHRIMHYVWHLILINYKFQMQSSYLCTAVL